MAKPWGVYISKSTAINLTLCLQTWKCTYYGWFILSFYGFVSNSCAHLSTFHFKHEFLQNRQKCAQACIAIEFIVTKILKWHKIQTNVCIAIFGYASRNTYQLNEDIILKINITRIWY